MAIIVNADDFGMSDAVNEAIRLSFEKGLIGRCTLMTNMEKAEDAMRIASECGFGDRVGIHLNLTAGKPLCEDMAKDPVMCDASGRFTAEFARSFKTRFFLPADTRRNVEKELRAQLDEYRRLGGTLWHIDSHHHVHTDPSVWKVLKKVLPDYPVTSVRLGRNMYRGGNPLMRIYKEMLNASIRRFCKGRPEYFGSYADYESFGEEVSDRETEVMIHPQFDEAGVLVDVTGGGSRKLTGGI